MPDSALDQLVQTLFQGTNSGTVKWQEATGDGNSFVTRRRVGTVTLQRRAGIAGAMGGQISLTVRDQRGDVITQLDSPSPTSVVAGGLTSAGARQLAGLFDAVYAKHIGDHAALQQFISEFGSPQ